jgi:predicted outer membrane repeat protein
MAFTVFLILFVLIGSVSATDDNITSLSQDTYNEIGQEIISTGNDDSSLKEIENTEILKTNNENTTLKTPVSGDTFTDIQTAIDSAASGDTIELDGLYKGSGTAIIIDKNNLTIIGNDAILDAQGQSRILNITGTEITLKNIKFINGNATDNGGAIYWYGDNGIINDCSFANNMATQRGGAIYWYGVNGTINNSNFINNTATKYSGGAIQWDSNSANGTVNNCNFTNNMATQKGGAIYWYGVNGTINNSNFINSTSIDGGAINWDHNAFNGVVNNSNFINNAGNDGGAFYWYGANGRMNNCNFINNTGTNGGAINWQRTYGVVNNCNFANNKATDGGAVYWEGTNGTENNCIFTDNKATDGGAVYWYGANGTIINSNFENNTAESDGGAVVWKGTNGTVTTCNFANNIAESNGGAIYVENDQMVVLNSKFIANTANITGGAIGFEGDELSVIESEFTNNTALDDSGAIYVYADKALISKSKFEGNNAPEVGAVYVSCDNALINESCFISNVAADYISAILNADGNLTVDNCQFIDSSTYSGCTIRNTMDSTLILSNSIFESDCLKGRTVDNNYGVLYLYNNTIDDLSSEIHNYGGLISSPCTATVISRTPFVYGAKTKLFAIITDDNGNLIEEGYYVYFNVNGSMVEAEFNSEISGYEAEYVFNSLGLVEISTVCPSINITDNQGINTSVIKADSSITAPDIVFDYGLFGSTVVTLNGAIGFNATVVNCSEAFVAVSGNEIFVSNLEAGNYSLNITTAPDSNHNSVSSIVKITVNKANATLIIPVTVFEYGKNITIVPILDGISKIDLAFVPYHDEAVVNISENNVITISGLVIGDYKLVISAIPDKNHNVMSAFVQNISVTKLKTQLTASSVTTTYNVAKKLVVTLEGSDGVLANRNVTVNVGTISKTLTTNSEGQVSVDVSSLTPKDYTASIKFAGDDNYSASDKSVKVTVNKATPKLTAKYKAFKAKVKTKKYSVTLKTNKNKPIKKAKVTLKVNGKTYSAKTNSKGKATFKITKLTKKGKYKAAIKFKGNSYYKSVSKSVKITVKK